MEDRFDDVITNIIRNNRIDRGLVAFIYKKDECIFHLGTGFLYRENIVGVDYYFIITAGHVIEDAQSNADEVMISIQINNDGEYILIPFSNKIPFVIFEEHDSAFTMLSKDFVDKYNLFFFIMMHILKFYA